MIQEPPAGPDELCLIAMDGYRLRALKYRPAGNARGNIILAGATGVPQRFYRRFAEYAASRGFATLTFDYRGIGMSKPASLKGFHTDFLEWAVLDLAAAVEAMADGAAPSFMVGHSFGGHAFGLLPNVERIASLYTFGTGAGWAGWMPPLERWRVRILWNVVGPAITWWKGYLAWNSLGMGEDLPLGVYKQWRRWCRYPRYFLDDPAMQQMAQGFEKIHQPVFAANAVDDLWAPPRSRDAFMSGYRNAHLHTIDLDPKKIGMAGIGHLGYFRSDAQPLWLHALDWFEAQQDRPQENRPSAKTKI